MKRLIIILLLMTGSFWSCKPPETKLVNGHLCLSPARLSASLSDSDLVEMATRYEMLSDAKTVFTAEQMARLREIRPKIRIIRYRNLDAIHHKSMEEWILRNHPDWVMRDSAGNHLSARHSPDATGLLMRANSDWKLFIAERASRDIVEGKYDGTMGDCVMMCGRLKKNFPGINTDTGLPYTTEQYRLHQLELVKAVKSAIGEKSLVLNNVKRGKYFFEEKPDSFLKVADGVVAEGFRGYSYCPLEDYLLEEDWIDNIKMMQVIQSRGKNIVVIVKVDKKIADQYTAQQMERWECFWYCTFLLGLQDSAYYAASIVDSDSNKKTLLFYEHHKKNLGNPVGEFSKEENYYRREFENGRVVIDLDNHIGRID